MLQSEPDLEGTRAVFFRCSQYVTCSPRHLMLLGKSIALNLTAGSSPRSGPGPPWTRGSAFPPVLEIFTSTLQEACLSRQIGVLMPSVSSSRLGRMRIRMAHNGPHSFWSPTVASQPQEVQDQVPPPFARQYGAEERLEGIPESLLS